MVYQIIVYCLTRSIPLIWSAYLRWKRSLQELILVFKKLFMRWNCSSFKPEISLLAKLRIFKLVKLSSKKTGNWEEILISFNLRRVSWVRIDKKEGRKLSIF